MSNGQKAAVTTAGPVDPGLYYELVPSLLIPFGETFFVLYLLKVLSVVQSFYFCFIINLRPRLTGIIKKKKKIVNKEDLTNLFDSAAGLGNYVEALSRKSNTEFSV